MTLMRSMNCALIAAACVLAVSHPAASVSECVSVVSASSRPEANPLDATAREEDRSHSVPHPTSTLSSSSRDSYSRSSRATSSRSSARSSSHRNHPYQRQSTAKIGAVEPSATSRKSDEKLQHDSATPTSATGVARSGSFGDWFQLQNEAQANTRKSTEATAAGIAKAATDSRKVSTVHQKDNSEDLDQVMARLQLGSHSSTRELPSTRPNSGRSEHAERQQAAVRSTRGQSSVSARSSTSSSGKVETSASHLSRRIRPSPSVSARVQPYNPQHRRSAQNSFRSGYVADTDEQRTSNDDDALRRIDAMRLRSATSRQPASSIRIPSHEAPKDDDEEDSAAEIQSIAARFNKGSSSSSSSSNSNANKKTAAARLPPPVRSMAPSPKAPKLSTLPEYNAQQQQRRQAAAAQQQQQLQQQQAQRRYAAQGQQQQDDATSAESGVIDSIWPDEEAPDQLASLD